MKKAFIAVAAMAGIIALRMILSVALGEQIAEVFTGISVSALLFYFLISISRNRRRTQKAENYIQ